MSIIPTTILPKNLFAGIRREKPQIQVSQIVVESAALDAAGVYARLGTRPQGLTAQEAEARLSEHGPNVLAKDQRPGIGKLFWHAVLNPLVILLAVLAAISFATGDARAGIVMSLMIAMGVGLKLIQEAKADSAAAKLKAMISVTATVVRDGVPHEIAFLGTSVESGSALAVVVATGKDTFLGGMAQSLSEQPTQTAFDRGIARFPWLMLRFILVMVPLVFVINGLTKGNWGEAFFFAVAVAVGLTPEMLPMIVTVCLSKGALAMSRKKVIVKRINAIQNLGAMDVLCTDKTGTLTMDHVILEKYCDVVLRQDDGVLALPYLNSYFQTGLKNVLDRAVLAHRETDADAHIPDYTKVDEIPFDFQRRIMSVVVRTPDGKDRIISKGAPEAIFPRCKEFELDAEPLPMDNFLIEELKEEYERLSADGFRVLAIASKEIVPRGVVAGDAPPYGKADECDLILNGYVAFLDPPKETATAAIRALQDHGVSVKVLTGDNDLVARKICKKVGLCTDVVLVGGEVEKMTDEELADAAEKTTVFARVSPAHKQRIIRALQSRKHTVGFMGDGINDAPALRTADVGISVDTAVDIA